MRLIVAVCVALLTTFVFAQEEDPSERIITVEEGEPQEVAPGIVITVNPDAALAQYELAEEIEFQPRHIESTIRFGDTFTSVLVTLSSRLVDTRVRLEPSDPNLLIATSKYELVNLLAGYRTSVGFTAYEPHQGVINVYNEEDALLASIPYTVRAESQVLQSVGASVRAEAGTDAGDGTSGFEYGYETAIDYSITERTTGITGRIGLNFDGEFEFDGQVSGRYSW